MRGDRSAEWQEDAGSDCAGLQRQGSEATDCVAPADTRDVGSEGSGEAAEDIPDAGAPDARRELFAEYINRFSEVMDRIAMSTPEKKNVLAAAFLAGTSLCLVTAAVDAQEREAATAGGLRCMANGYDVVVINEGSAELEAGTVVEWSVSSVRVGGEVTLDEGLPASGSHFLTAALGSNYTNPRVKCVVTVREP